MKMHCRRIVCFLLFLIMLFSSSLAATLEWTDLLDDLSDTELLQLQTVLKSVLISRNLEKVDASIVKVYLTTSGQKFHATLDCSKMKEPRLVPIEAAILCGYEPCKKCYK